MKIIRRKLDHATISIDKPEYPIFAGITITNDDKIMFDWDKDSPRDVLKLAESTSGKFIQDGITYFYAYTWSDTATPYQINRVRRYLKSLGETNDLYGQDVEDFVELGVLKFDEFKSLKSFSVLVGIEPSKFPSLVDIMNGYLMEYSQSPIVDIRLVKNTYDHVEFDSSKAYKALLESGLTQHRAAREIQFTIRKFQELKTSGALFEMKRFLPRAIREGFYNFLKFKTEEEKQLYMKLQGVDVLIYDGFLTSGSTIKEVVRYLKSIHNENQLTVFVLVKQ